MNSTNVILLIQDDDRPVENSTKITVCHRSRSPCIGEDHPHALILPRRCVEELIGVDTYCRIKRNIMVSFICDHCQEVKTKPKALAHFSSCRHCTTMSCIDCGVTFTSRTIGPHTSCVSEAVKYGPRSSAGVDSQTYCSTCSLSLNGAVHALQHYESKKHRKMSRQKSSKPALKQASEAQAPSAQDALVPEADSPPEKKPAQDVPVQEADSPPQSKTIGKLPRKLLRRTLKAAISKSDSRRLSVKKLIAVVKVACGENVPDNLEELVTARCSRSPFQTSKSAHVSLL